MRELILIRHGVTAWNRQHVLQGHIDVPLSPLGRWQSQMLAHHLLQEAAPDMMYVSDLSRARETAECLLELRSSPVRFTPALRERAFGSFEGRPWDEVRSELLRLEASMPPGTYQPPGGESRQAMVQRVLGFLEEAHRLHPQGRVWMISHGGVIRLLLNQLLGADTVSLTSGYQIPNSGMTRLRWEEERWHAVQLNCVDHLEGREPPEHATVATDESLLGEGP